MQKTNKIVLTGGHAGTTALATIQELKKSKVNWQIFWIGTEKAIEGKSNKTLEFKIFPQEGVICYPLKTGRLQRKWTRYTLISMARIPFGFIHAFGLLLKIKPRIVLSYGGFAGFPVVIAAYFLRIPVILHEQTVAVGLANKLSGFFAKKIAISREESRQYFNSSKTVLVGNPLMQSILSIKAKNRLSTTPTIYLAGGSRGSQIINSAFSGALEIILKDFKVIHHTGELDYEKFLDIKSKLPRDLAAKYEVHDFIDPREIGKVYERADITISRAGANTVAEIIYIKLPAIIIPIPWTRFDEQTKNAKMAEKIGIARVINQDELTPEILIDELKYIVKNWKKMTQYNDSTISILDKNASSKLVQEVEALVE